MEAFWKISNNESPHASMILRGLGTSGNPHPDLVAFLISQWLEVHYFDRQNDKLLSESPKAVEQYLEKIQQSVSLLIGQGKQIHLLGISFGAYLSLKVAENTWTMVSSVVAIAPLIDPYTVISKRTERDADWVSYVNLSNNLRLSILPENIQAVKNQSPKNIIPPGIIIMWDSDGFEKPESLVKVTGKDLQKYILPNVRHEETTGHSKTRILLDEFYRRIIA